MTITLMAYDFLDTGFCRNSICPIEKAIQRLFSNQAVFEYVDHTLINGVQYKHDPYTFQDYREDFVKATNLYYNHSLVRQIKLTKT